jgi:LmbE family N-acetylglucosaminyl deacetylase
VGGHQDDLEIMAYHGILKCFDSTDLWFGGITCTDGAGSPRRGPYGHYSDEEMQHIRRQEQRQAAAIGRYGLMAQLGYPSHEIKNPRSNALVGDLAALFGAGRPEVIYTHNPADKHETHAAVVVAVIKALRTLPAGRRPREVYGCEVWRGLDWMPDGDKVLLDVGGRGNVWAALLGVYDSQVAGGKRYDSAVMGRSRANAVFFQPHRVDEADEVWFAMDLTPLVLDDSLDMADYVGGLIDRFSDDVMTRLRRMCAFGQGVRPGNHHKA